ncbi:unnamed protein product [Urochloa humidicola]
MWEDQRPSSSAWEVIDQRRQGPALQRLHSDGKRRWVLSSMRTIMKSGGAGGRSYGELQGPIDSPIHHRQHQIANVSSHFI